MILQVVTTLTSSPLSREDSLLGGFRFKPSEQYAKVKLDHLPRDRGENTESFCPPPIDSGMDSKRLQMQQTQGPTTPSSPSATTILTPDLLQELYGQLGSALLVALVDGHGTWPSGKPAWLPPRWYWNEDVRPKRGGQKHGQKHNQEKNGNLSAGGWKNRDNCKFL